jgi:hypothetical protein
MSLVSRCQFVLKKLGESHKQPTLRMRIDGGDRVPSWCFLLGEPRRVQK